MLLSTDTKAELRLSPLFSEGAVLQRDAEIPVWGSADPGEAVAIKLNGAQAQTVADASGRWTAKLPAQPAGGPYELSVSGSGEEIAIKDVAVGEVWFAAGQSNMAFSLEALIKHPVYGPPHRDAIASSGDPLLRMFTVGRIVVGEGPLDNMAGPKGSWKEASPGTTPKFSATAYYFAAELRKRLNVPVGIISSAVGSTPAEYWTSGSALSSEPAMKVFYDRWEKTAAEYPIKMKSYEEAAETAKAEGKAPPAKPFALMTPPDSSKPGNLFNGMVAPLIPYGIKGVIWYQGESNSGGHYRTLFPLLIKDWRGRWGQGDFPFLYVQLAGHKGVQKQPSEGGWALLREAQMLALSLPNTGMASAIDLADADNPDNIHPHNKQDVGKRLSLVALATVYGEKVSSYSGPIYSGFEIKGSEVWLSFRHADGGLMAKGGELKGFAIAGKDKKFAWGEARIEGNAVVVASREISDPVAVRYGWAMNPIGNLYNGEGLPASSFRTDLDGIP